MFVFKEKTAFKRISSTDAPPILATKQVSGLVKKVLTKEEERELFLRISKTIA